MFWTSVYQDVFKEVSLTEPKIQAETPSDSGDCVSGESQLLHPSLNTF